MIPIVFAINEEYGIPCYLAIYSLKRVMDIQQKYEVTILYNNLSQKIKNKLKSCACKNLKINFFCVNKYLHSDMYETSKYPKEIYFRLLIPQLLPYDKVLYLDSDILVMKDVQELYNVDMSEYFIAGVQDNVKSLLVNSKTYKIYVNSGVLLINCSTFRKNHLFEKYMKYLKKHPFLTWPDQDALNIVCKQHIKLLSPVWNTLIQPKKPWIGRANNDNSAILHFSSPYKPWNSGKDNRYAVYYDMVKEAGETDWFFSKMKFQKQTVAIQNRMAIIANHLYIKSKYSPENESILEEKIIKLLLLLLYIRKNPNIVREKLPIISQEIILFPPKKISDLKKFLYCIDFIQTVKIYSNILYQYHNSKQLIEILMKSKKVSNICIITSYKIKNPPLYIDKKYMKRIQIQQITQSDIEYLDKRKYLKLEPNNNQQDLYVQNYYCEKNKFVFWHSKCFICIPAFLMCKKNTAKNYIDFSESKSKRQLKIELQELLDSEDVQVCKHCKGEMK